MTTQLEISTASINDLLLTYEDAREATAAARLLENKLEMEIYHRIESLGGTTLPNADANGEQIWECVIESTYTYDHTFFRPLLEMLNKT